MNKKCLIIVIVILLVCTITVGLIVLFSVNNNSEDDLFEDILYVKEDSDMLCKYTFMIGVNKVSPHKVNNDECSIKLDREAVNLNGFDFTEYSDLKLYKTEDKKISICFWGSENILIIGKNSDIKMKIKEDLLEYSDSNIDMLDDSVQTEIVQLIILYKELTDENLERSKKETNKLKSVFSMYAMSIRYTRSSAIRHSMETAKRYAAENNCDIVGGPDVGCLWEDFGCISVVEMDCH